ncbi:MAG: hypothetical protein HZA22_04715 [Nitrospirae bacterium]|nr:hypothetical protein [Nitrospirota bacterium]
MTITGQTTDETRPDPQTGGPVVGDRNQTLVDLVKGEGFDYRMLDFRTDADLDTYLINVLDKAQRNVQAEVGETVYLSDDVEIAAAVQDAVVSFAVHKCWLRRRTIVAKSVAYSGEQHVRSGITEENAAQAALDEFWADTARALRLAGTDTGFSCSAEVSSHFSEAS